MGEEAERRGLHLAEALRLAAEPGAGALDAEAWARARRPRRTARDVLREGAVLGAAAGYAGRVARTRS